MTEIERATERLQRFSGRMAALIVVLIVVSPVLFAAVAYGKGLGHLLEVPALDTASLSGPEVALVTALAGLRPFVTWLALWPLLALFRLFGRGLIFEAANLHRLRQLGGLLIAVDVAHMVQRALIGPVLSWLGATEPYVEVSLVFSMAMVGLFVLAVARVMEIGRELKEADALTI